MQSAWAARLDGLSGQVSLQLRSADGQVAGRRADQTHYAASTIKLAVLGALLASGTETGLVVHSDFTGALGGTFELSQADDQDDDTWAELGTVTSSAILAERMIQLSGNLATDLLVEHLGLDAVAAFLARAGNPAGEHPEIAGLRIDRLIGDSAAEAAGITNTVTAAGLAELLAALASPGSPSALDLLAGQRHRNLIPAGIPEGTWTASKSGWVPGVRHDVALIRPDSAPEYVLAVCTSGLPDDEAEAVVVDLSRITWQEWMQWHG